MGRSSKVRARQNRSRIVEEASRLFRRFGVESVSVTDIMQATGMTAGCFYKHFDSKDALVQEAFSLSFEQAGHFWANISEKNGSAGASSAIVRQYLTRRPLDQTCPILAFSAHVASDASGPLARAAYRAGTKHLFSQFIGTRQQQDAKVTMLGAGFLAHILKDDKWVRAVQSAVESTAKRHQECAK